MKRTFFVAIFNRIVEKMRLLGYHSGTIILTKVEDGGAVGTNLALRRNSTSEVSKIRTESAY